MQPYPKVQAPRSAFIFEMTVTVAVIVQARFGDLKKGRYPGKVLLPLPTGRTVLEEVLFRCQAIPGIDVVVAALPDTPDTLPLLPFVRRAQDLRRNHDLIDEYVRFMESRGERDLPTDLAGAPGAREWDYGRTPIELVHGPEDDVLTRYVIAADAVKADVIMRVTADCPLISPDVCGTVIDAFFENQPLDYACNCLPQTWPHGYDCEVFSYDTLQRANHAPKRDAEGVDTWMQTSPGVRRLNIVNPDGDYHRIRLTLDTPADYLAIHNEMVRRIWAWTGHEREMRV